jgi:hypothetical protein
MQPPGWMNSRSYPLLLSKEDEWALGKMMGDRKISKGKALNQALHEGLIVLGYLERPRTPEQLRNEASAAEAVWVKEHWAEMSPKAREYWSKRYPQGSP